MKKYIIIILAVILGILAAKLLLSQHHNPEKEPQSISIKDDRLIFHYDDTDKTRQIETEVIPSDSKKYTMSFTSRDTDIAEVSETGLVTVTGALGETVIDITYGELNAEVEISVVKGVDGITLNQSEITLNAYEQHSIHLDASVYPDDATIKEISWHSSDESIAHADSNGNVYPCGKGTAEIYAVTVDGEYKAACTVTINTPPKNETNIRTVYTDYDITLYDLVMKQMEAAPSFYDTAENSESDKLFANDEEVEGFAKPDNFLYGYNKFQFMVLNEDNGISAELLDRYLLGKGVFEGKGALFRQTAEDNNLSELFLVLLSCIETENGCSPLATGTEINGVVVYNPYGIGHDAADAERGVRLAYEQGWITLDSAIAGGAKWLSENYINNENNKQNTLYKMRWNPESPTEHQYTRDVAWASDLAWEIGEMAEMFLSAEYSFDIARYEDGKTVAG